MNIERVHAWINQGAQLSESVSSLLRRDGYDALSPEAKESAAKKRAKRRAAFKSRAKKDGTKFVPASRRAVNKHQKALKVQRLAEQEEKLAAHRAAQEAAAEAEAPAEESSEG